MELTILIPMIGELLKQEGSFGQKLLVGVGFLIAIHLMGRNHIKLITAEMKSMKQEMVKGFESVHGKLAVGEEAHQKHEQRITKIEKQVQEIQSSKGLTV